MSSLSRIAAPLFAVPGLLAASNVLAESVQTAAAAPAATVAGSGGISALWILANASYAGMRAQNSPSSGWRAISFIVGLPGTLITLMAVPEGGEKAYGIQLPRRPTGQ